MNSIGRDEDVQHLMSTCDIDFPYHNLYSEDKRCRAEWYDRVASPEHVEDRRDLSREQARHGREPSVPRMTPVLSMSNVFDVLLEQR